MAAVFISHQKAREKNPRGVVFLHSPLIQLCLAKSTGWQTKQRSSVRAAATQRWRGWEREPVIRGTQDRHVLVAKPQPELMSRRGMPPSTNEGATSITVSQAQSARVWAGLLEPILGVQFSGLGKWQPHSYSNQRRHSESFSFQWGRRVNRVILSGRQLCWIMEGCVLSACLTEGRWAKGATLRNSLARGFHISTADSS